MGFPQTAPETGHLWFTGGRAVGKTTLARWLMRHVGDNCRLFSSITPDGFVEILTADPAPSFIVLDIDEDPEDIATVFRALLSGQLIRGTVTGQREPVQIPPTTRVVAFSSPLPKAHVDGLRRRGVHVAHLAADATQVDIDDTLSIADTGYDKLAARIRAVREGEMTIGKAIGVLSTSEQLVVLLGIGTPAAMRALAKSRYPSLDEAWRRLDGKGRATVLDAWRGE